MEAWEEELVAKVRALSRETFTQRATKHDREGSFVADNVADLKALGVPGMAIAKEYGGLGVSAETWIRVIEEVAYGDGSTAVALNMHMLAGDGLSAMPPFPRRDVVLKDMGTNNALACGAISIPTGEIDNRGAGFRVAEDGDDLVINGKAGFASMSEGASYTIIGGRIDRGEGNEPDVVITLPSMDSPGLKLMHNWDGMGLRGTASHDIVAEDLRISKADAMVVPAAVMKAVQAAQAGINNPMIQGRGRGALGIAAIWLGLSQAAFDFTLNYVRERHGSFVGGAINDTLAPVGFRADQAWAQMGIGHMDHWIESGRTMLYAAVANLSKEYSSQQEYLRMAVRTIYHLRRMGEEVAQESMRVCGAHAYVRSRPLERIFRDLVGSNVMAWKTEELKQTLGRAALGQSITIGGPAG